MNFDEYSPEMKLSYIQDYQNISLEIVSRIVYSMCCGVVNKQHNIVFILRS